MTQHAIVHQVPFSYSRGDFAALRAWVQRVPVDKIAELYYVDEAPQVANGLEKFLVSMRHDLIERAILANPLFADSLAKARLGGAISVGVLNVLIKAAEATPLPPVPNDLIAQWFRRKVAQQLVAEGVKTLAQLKELIEARGYSWWRSIPRIGAMRAAAIVAWMNKFEGLAINQASQIQAIPAGHQIVLADQPVPLARISALPVHMDGSDGINRAVLFSYIQVKNDLEAIQAYLSRVKSSDHTYRAYQRELERLLLWSILVRNKPLSSLLVHDCEAYKDFLASPAPEFTGARSSRSAPRWRPFTGELSPFSQCQAVQIIRSAFSWLASVRYLAGNPWLAVKDPRTVKRRNAMQVERALRSDLWIRALSCLDRICLEPHQKQARIARAAIHLMGGSGLRSSEAAGAKLGTLKRSPFARVAELTIVGKGNVERVVLLSSVTIAALEAHWNDHGQTLVGNDAQDLALIRPLVLPATANAQTRHLETGHGYAPVALSRLVKSVLSQVAESDEFDFSEADALRSARAHDLRHTFATLAVERQMPIDVVQKLLGHTSLATTSIYVQAEQRRIAVEAEKLFEAHLQAGEEFMVSVDNTVEKDEP